MTSENDAQLRRWWKQLSDDERAAAVRSTATGVLPDGLESSLRAEGHPATRSDSPKMGRDVEKFLKMRHDT